MRLVEFLTHILKAQAQTLQRLAALLGEERLVELLETAGESEGFRSHSESLVLSMEKTRHCFDSPRSTAGAHPYRILEGVVHEFKLPPLLEFHLWAFPLYRAFVEGSLDLNSRIRMNNEDAAAILVGEVVTQAAQWIRILPLEPSIAHQAEAAASVPWLRFRTEVLKKIGKRHLGPSG